MKQRYVVRTFEIITTEYVVLAHSKTDAIDRVNAGEETARQVTDSHFTDDDWEVELSPAQ